MTTLSNNTHKHDNTKQQHTHNTKQQQIIIIDSDREVNNTYHNRDLLVQIFATPENRNRTILEVLKLVVVARLEIIRIALSCYVEV